MVFCVVARQLLGHCYLVAKQLLGYFDRMLGHC